MPEFSQGDDLAFALDLDLVALHLKFLGNPHRLAVSAQWAGSFPFICNLAFR